MSLFYPKPFTVTSKAIRELPKRVDIHCTLRLDGCPGGPVCLCHVRNDRAIGGNKKPDDSFGYYGCDHCHRIQEARKADDWDVLCAIYESQHLMHAHGVLFVK